MHEVLYNSLTKLSYESKKDFFCNLIMAGGSTLFPGITYLHGASTEND